MTRTYQIASRVIEITSLHQEVHNLCRDYLFEGTPDFSVTTTQEDITFEREKSAQEDIFEGRPVMHFPDPYLETLAVYRKIACHMLAYDTLLFHGSVIAVDGVGYLFTAKSGTGKSTHTRLWRELFGDRAVMVNDDKPLLRVTPQGVIACGTPWNGKHGLGINTEVPLKAVCVLERAAKNHISPIDRWSVYPMLLQQTYRPEDPMQMGQVLALIDKLMDGTAFYRLGCNMDPEAAKVAYLGMNGKETAL